MTKFLDSLPTVERKELADLSQQINTQLFSGNEASSTALKHYLQAGVLMNKVKLELGSDIRFLEWRKDHITCNSSWARKLCRAAAKYGEKVPKGIESVSVLVELSAADPETEKKLLDKAAGGEKVTQKEVAEHKREQVRNNVAPAKEPVMTLAQQQRALDEKPKTLTLEEQERVILDLEPADRIEKALNPCHVLGFSNFSENLPAVDTIELIAFSLGEEHGKHSKKVEAAMRSLIKERG